MSGASERFHPPPGVPPIAGYIYDPVNDVWTPLAGVDQGNGTVALAVTGAGITPTATSIKIASGNGTTEAVTDGAGALQVRVVNPSGGGSGGLTDAELRASPVPVDTGLSQGLTNTQLRAAPVPVDNGQTQPLTDTQLRASAVPVSGPLTNAQLRATPVPVDTGVSPLTDSQLRATPVPVSGTVSTGLAQPLTDAQLRASRVPVDNGLSQGVTRAQLDAALVAVSDDYTSGTYAATQTGANAVLTFTLAQTVDLVWVRDIGSITTNVSYADPFGGTPSNGSGIPVPNGEPVPMTIRTGSVKVWAPTGSVIAVYGYGR